MGSLVERVTYDEWADCWAFCSSVVIMGCNSCFLRFLPLPLDEAEAATCLALLIAAFLISEPFMLEKQESPAG